MIAVSKSDWKLFQEKLPVWQENYMERLIKEYISLLSAPGNASDHFWDLEKRIKKDRRHPGVQLAIEKSETIWNIADLIRSKVITLDDLDGFSEDLINEVRMMLEM